MSFTKITVLGNLTKSPELRYTPKGNAVCTFNIAVNERERDTKTGELTERVNFFKATAWGKQAEAVAAYFERGSEIYVEGKFKPEIWTDKDGKERTTFGIQVTDFNFTGGTNRNSGRVVSAAAATRAQNQTSRNQNSSEFNDLDDSDIPF